MLTKSITKSIPMVRTNAAQNGFLSKYAASRHENVSWTPKTRQLAKVESCP